MNSEDGRVSRPYLYHPAGMRMWDVWMLHDRGVTHAFHLMAPRGPGAADPERVPLGHATSSDLLTWTEEPPVMDPGPPGSLDDMQFWTGDAVMQDGEVFLYYTGRSSRERGLVQRTMLARTRDLRTWQRSSTPVIEADGRWYISEQIPERADTVSWRDPKLVHDPSTGLWHCFIAADTIEGPFAGRGCIARAVSTDLVHWEVRPPALAPGRYACLEVPDVFRLDDRWYLTALTGTVYGNGRGAMRDPHVTMGTIYAVSESLEGPFVEVADNVLLGSSTMDGTSLRSVEVDGTRYGYYWLAEREGAVDSGRPALGVLGTPKVLDSDTDGRLRLRVAPAVESLFGDPIEDLGVAAFASPRATVGGGSWGVDDDRLEVSCERGWTVRCAGPVLESFSMSVRIGMGTAARAGVLIHAEPHADHAAPHPQQWSLAVLLDVQERSLRLCRLRDFLPIVTRTLDLAPDVGHVLRIVMLGEFIEVYVDGALWLNTVRYELPRGTVGLFVEAGTAWFDDLAVRPLAAEVSRGPGADR